MKTPYTYCRLGSKRRYANARLASEALVAAQALRHKTGAAKMERDFYECEKCSGWHLTSDPVRRLL